MKKILLIDGNSLLYRAYFATAYSKTATLKTQSGIPTNGLYGFINMILAILEKEKYYDVKVAFDKGKKTFRHQKMEAYKANRQQTPTDLISQIPLAQEFLTNVGIEWYTQDNYEADDLIGSINQNILIKYPEFVVDILSSDKDLFQLISPKTTILIPQSGTSDLLRMDETNVKVKWCEPNQVPDLKGLMGDPSDNLKGVRGVGEKTAIKLIHDYQSLENIYQHLEELKPKLQEKLELDKESAFFCREMATIIVDAELTDLSFSPLKFDRVQLFNFLKKYEMNSIIKRLGLSPNNDKEKPEIKVNVKTNIKMIREWKKEYEALDNAIFVQTIDANYHIGKIIGIAIANKKGTFFLDQQPKKEQLTFFEELINNDFDNNFNNFLKNPTLRKMTYDIKKTVTLLKNANYECSLSSFDFDLMIAGYDLDSNMGTKFVDCVKTIDSTLVVKEDGEVFGLGVAKNANIPLETKAEFISEKANIIFQIKAVALTKLKENNQLELYEKIDLPFSFVLYKMEQIGIKIDLKELKKQSEIAIKKIKQIEKEIHSLLRAFPETEGINLSSPKQLQHLLFDILKLPNLKNGSTEQEVLTKLISKHPIITMLLEHRKYSNIYATSLGGFKRYIHSDSRVHTIYNETLTNTGRISSIEPNLQNISIHNLERKQVRKILISDPNTEFYSFDYSQIELRVLAQLADEENLIKAFQEGKDIHELAARKIFDLKEHELVNEESRRIAKVFNFGLVYGLTSYGLAKDLDISTEKAKELIISYFDNFPNFLAYKEKQIKFAKEHGYVLTESNRKRYIHELTSDNYHISRFGERIAVNMPIQGTAADILKVAMIDIDREIIKNKWKSCLVAQIHDEIIVQVVKNETEQVISMIKEKMEKAFLNLLKLLNKSNPLEVSLELKVSHNNNWYNLK